MSLIQGVKSKFLACTYVSVCNAASDCIALHFLYRYGNTKDRYGNTKEPVPSPGFCIPIPVPGPRVFCLVYHCINSRSFLSCAFTFLSNNLLIS